MLCQNVGGVRVWEGSGCGRGQDMGGVGMWEGSGYGRGRDVGGVRIVVLQHLQRRGGNRLARDGRASLEDGLTLRDKNGLTPL